MEFAEHYFSSRLYSQEKISKLLLNIKRCC